MLKQNINREWTLKHRTSSIMESVMGASDEEEVVNLPHDGMVSMDRSADAVSGPGMAYFQCENLSYEKKLFIPLEEADQVHYLNLDGVNPSAKIYVNGIFAAQHFYGYAPCTVRVDEFLRYGAENTIKVEARGSSEPFSRWYPGVGIYRDAWLLTGDYLHIPCDGVHVTTQDCDDQWGVLEVKTLVRNVGPRAREGYAALEILDAQGTVVAARKAKFYVKAGDEVLVRQRIHVENPQLWNVDTPNLYTCRCRLLEGETEVDVAVATFGIRKLQLDSKRGLRINGQSVKLKGGCVHHDNGVLGAVTVADAEERRVRILKEGGYNAIRTSHNPPSAALLDACDKLGLLVFHEFTDIWTQNKSTYDYAEYFADRWESDVEAVVRRDYNHPSVILWSIGNEIPETGNTIATQWGRKLAEKFRSLDNTRFVTNGINVMVSCAPVIGEVLGQPKEGEDKKADGVNDLLGGLDNFMDLFGLTDAFDKFVEESCDMLDVVGYNYTTPRYEREHLIHPDWVFVGSETFPAALDENWAVVSRNPYVLGDFCWTAWDYLGEVGCGRIVPKELGDNGFMGAYPWLAACDGDFDLTGFRKAMSYWREIVWGGGNHKPYLAVHRLYNYGKDLQISRWNFTDAIHCWTWPGYEGKETAVEVYSDAEEVELFVNGQSLGRKPVGDSFKKFYCRWETTYTPGEVVAVAYIGGKEVGRDVLATAGESRLCLRADKTTLRAGSSDLCYLEIELRDAQGTLDMTAEGQVRVEVEGNAVLAGCGSANPCTEEKYCDCEHAVFEGRVLAVLKAGDAAGTATVTVTCTGREPATLKLEIC